MTTYVDDNFDARSPTTGTLGAAPTGGDYTGDGAATDIVSGEARITHAAAANTVCRLLSATATQDTDYVITVRTDKVPTGALIELRMPVRMQDSTTYYRASVDVQTNGSVDLECRPLIANVAGTIFLTVTGVPGLTWAAATDYKVRVQAQGINPTTIRMKVWDASGSEPGSWHGEATDSDATLQTTGTYGFVMRTTSGMTNFPIASFWDDWLVTDEVGGGGGGGPGGVSVRMPAGGL